MTSKLGNKEFCLLISLLLNQGNPKGVIEPEVSIRRAEEKVTDDAWNFRPRQRQENLMNNWNENKTPKNDSKIPSEMLMIRTEEKVTSQSLKSGLN